jgi:hypothetical protein
MVGHHLLRTKEGDLEFELHGDAAAGYKGRGDAMRKSATSGMEVRSG